MSDEREVNRQNFIEGLREAIMMISLQMNFGDASAPSRKRLEQRYSPADLKELGCSYEELLRTWHWLVIQNTAAYSVLLHAGAREIDTRPDWATADLWIHNYLAKAEQPLDEGIPEDFYFNTCFLNGGLPTQDETQEFVEEYRKLEREELQKTLHINPQEVIDTYDICKKYGFL